LIKAMRRRHVLSIAGGLMGLPLALRSALAWPDQPIRLVVPFTPAGGPDIIARFVAERLSLKLGQPVTVENVPRWRAPGPTARR
jgi:tripartite-type tricarboxylate transporter receptor subunit TctC